MPKRLTTDEFVERAIAVHGDRYDYSQTHYRTQKHKVNIRCPDHGMFSQLPTNHTNGGNGCPKCFNARTGNRCRSDTVNFIKKADLIHEGRYDYSKTHYQTAKKKITIICQKHGEFQQTPNKHLSGNGCPACKAEVISGRRVISLVECQRRVGALKTPYQYDWDSYVSYTTDMRIICNQHGEFWQTPVNHINHKNRCPRCSNRVSRESQSWLDKLGIPPLETHREVRGLIPSRKYEVDGFDPETKTVYEFLGDYWHGNPEIYDPDAVNPSCKLTFGELHKRTMERQEDFIRHGYNYVSIWESEWTNE